jgi:prepilin-type N-terminal cleavage/methylation domain-containing protein
MRRARHQSGFTLIEMLVVIALIAILATIALPSFFRTGRKARGMAEVQPMFSDLRQRIEAFHQENGLYPATIGEGPTHPATPTETKQTLYPLPAAWVALKIRPSGPDEVNCGYTWVSGLPDDGTNIGAQGAAFGFTAPAVNWYYLLAHCDMDGDPGVDAYYFTRSDDTALVRQNEGR